MSKAILVPIIGDNNIEQTESFFVIYNPNPYSSPLVSATVTIIDDDSPTLTASSEPTPVSISIEAPKKATNVFTPNGDGVNDLFYIEGLENTTNELTVLSKSGQQIFRQANYKNDWDGTGAPDGTYFYFLKTKDDDGKAVLKKGFVTVLRQSK